MASETTGIDMPLGNRENTITASEWVKQRQCHGPQMGLEGAVQIQSNQSVGLCRIIAFATFCTCVKAYK